MERRLQEFELQASFQYKPNQVFSAQLVKLSTDQRRTRASKSAETTTAANKCARSGIANP